MTTPPPSGNLELAPRGDRHDVTFNRSKIRNTISAPMSRKMASVIDWLEAAPEVRAVVLRGKGGHFSAGADIKARRTMVNAPEASGNPVVGRSAFGGSFGYACLTDMTIIPKSERIGMPETTIGVAPAQIAPYGVRRIDLARARQPAMTGERIDGAIAYARGDGQYVCPERCHHDLHRQDARGWRSTGP